MLKWLWKCSRLDYIVSVGASVLDSDFILNQNLPDNSFGHPQNNTQYAKYKSRSTYTGWPKKVRHFQESF